MLQVECESCHAPYQVDERRVPAAGLKMRCPKCGHSFVVAAARAEALPAPIPAPPAKPVPAPPAKVERPRSELPSDFPAALGSLDEPDLPVISADLPSAKKAPPRPVAKAGSSLAAAGPAPSMPPARQPPPALARSAPVGPNSADFGDIHLDLPDVAPDLPQAARRAVPKSSLPGGERQSPARRSDPAPGAGGGARRPPPPNFDVDLPATLGDLPVIVGDRSLRGNLVDLPSVAAHLPVTAGNLPVAVAGLPVAAAGLPVAATNLPSLARGFGEIDLPTAGDSVPIPQHHRPGDSISPLASFGEIELPREATVVRPSPPARVADVGVGREPSADFEELELDERPRSPGRISSPRAAMVNDARQSAGGMTFGEVELSSNEGAFPAADPGIGIEASFTPAADPVVATSYQAAATAQVRTGVREPAVAPAERTSKKRSFGKTATVGLLAAALLGGAAMQLTPSGAFGYLYLQDLAYANAYDRAAVNTIAATEKMLGADTYDAARDAVELAAAAHARTPRAKPLTAYAALVDGAVAVRFGPDGRRASRAKQLLAELPVRDQARYREIALAAQEAESGEIDKARAGLEVAGKRDMDDPIQVEVALLRGEIELAARDGTQALAAFKRARELSNDARAHFGLARAYDALDDGANAANEVEATLLLSPQHVGALTLRARANGARRNEDQAAKDLAEVLEGPARAKASPRELSKAYAARAWLCLDRGSASEARDAFGRAVQLDPHNIAALRGEGRLLLTEGRYTEALARFDSALQLDPGSPEAIADDAEAKVALERLADAKQQLTEARQRFPRSVAIVQLLGRVEQHLGNSAAAEADLRAAVAMVDPARRDAVLPYVALSELLSSRGRLSDAKATLDEARQKLVPSAALDRALGEVAELQGEHDTAVRQYRAAIAKDPRDVASRFRLAVTLRRIRRFDEAGAELDKVAVVDKDYPGLSLERGLLFEESGDVEKAIEQFKGALAKAPNDPDLQLRVGSAYVSIGRPDDAIPMLHKVLDARPASAEAHHFIGRALMLKGAAQQADAIRYLKRAVDLDPNRAEFHVYLAWAANEAMPAQLELARDEIDKALALDKLAAEAYWQKGVLERMEGAIEDAIKHEKRALELRPSRYEAHATLAECYQDRNDDAMAISEWAKAIAGEGDAKNPDGGVLHPYWRYKYGRLLLEHGSVGTALSLLLPAAATLERSDQHPAWMAPLEFLTALALRKSGRKADAVEHYRRFLDVAPVSSPDRPEAEMALKQLTGSSSP